MQIFPGRLGSWFRLTPLPPLDRGASARYLDVLFVFRAGPVCCFTFNRIACMTKLAPYKVSNLGRHLLLEWGWGLASAPVTQRTAARAVQDGLRQPLIQSIASLGQWGACPRNIQQQLFNRFKKTVHPDRLVLEIKGGKGITHMIAPHELFHTIREKVPCQFTLRFGATETKCHAFWSALWESSPGREFMEQHEHLRNNMHRLHRIVPLLIHMDAGPYSKTTGSAMGLSVTSLLGIGSEAETIFMMATWLKDKVSIFQNTTVWVREESRHP